MEPYAEVAMAAGIAGAHDTVKSEEQLIEELFGRYGRALYRYALAIVNSADDAEDVVQEVWVRVAREHKRLRKVRNVQAYLFSATRNTAYNALRTRRRRREVDETYIDLDRQPAAEKVETSMESAALRECFSQLPIEQREVLALKVGDEMTFEEIARTVGAPANTVASRYRYGIERLRRALEAQNG